MRDLTKKEEFTARNASTDIATIMGKTLMLKAMGITNKDVDRDGVITENAEVAMFVVEDETTGETIVTSSPSPTLVNICKECKAAFEDDEEISIMFKKFKAKKSGREFYNMVVL